MDTFRSVELAFEHVTSPGRATQRLLFLHGMLGRGANLRTIARRFVDQRPAWDAWLVDLRGHGASPKGSPEPSLAAAADDVLALCSRSIPVGAIVGHSFGGKVALQAAQRALLHPSNQAFERAVALAQPVHVVTIDSNPGTRRPEEVAGRDSALSVIRMLRTLPRQFPSRAAFVDAVQAHGLSRMLAQWLAQSTEQSTDGGVRFALNLDELQALLASYFAEDLWPLIEQPPSSLRVHLIIGARSSSYSTEDRERAQALAANSAQVTCDVLPTDHWVHAEDPEGLLQRLWIHIPS